MGWRGDVRDFFEAGLNTFQAANPTLVTHIYSARPASLTDARIVFIGGISEEIAHDAGTWRRAAEVTLVCARALGENTEVIDDLEDLADALVDYLSQTPHLTGGLTYQEPVRTVTTELPDGGTFLPAVAVVARAYIQQGRT
jgi:hypothetical protein